MVSILNMIPTLIIVLLIQPKFSLSSCTRRPRNAPYDLSFESGKIKSDIYMHKNAELLNDPQCGLANSDRIIGGEKAALGAYPWLAMLGYLNKNEINFRCAGSVINKWYILSAAHCVKDKGTSLKKIRLGEHRLDTNPDCEGELFCNDPYKEYVVVEMIFHKNYNNPTFQNDIALLRVDREIQFTEFIRPICLPYGRLTNKNFTGLLGEVAGWGIYDLEYRDLSPYLLTVKLPILDMSSCGGYRPRKIALGPTQLCVGGHIGQDSCGGDSGGPLMRVDEDDALPGPRYYILGIVSFGSSECGATSLPGVYTRIFDYVPWILDNIRP